MGGAMGVFGALLALVAAALLPTVSQVPSIKACIGTLPKLGSCTRGLSIVLDASIAAAVKK